MYHHLFLPLHENFFPSATVTMGKDSAHSYQPVSEIDNDSDATVTTRRRGRSRSIMQFLKHNLTAITIGCLLMITTLLAITVIILITSTSYHEVLLINQPASSLADRLRGQKAYGPTTSRTTRKTPRRTNISFASTTIPQRNFTSLGMLK